MNSIKKDELFGNLNTFLKSKGIEMSEGTYSSHIKQGCNLLADAINATQKTVSDARVEVDQALDKLRQAVHERTAPSPPPQSKSKSRSAPDRKSSTTSASKKGGAKA
jgi:hypothetical protein